jgi:hypothetical protein
LYVLYSRNQNNYFESYYIRRTTLRKQVCLFPVILLLLSAGRILDISKLRLNSTHWGKLGLRLSLAKLKRIIKNKFTLIWRQFIEVIFYLEIKKSWYQGRQLSFESLYKVFIIMTDTISMKYDTDYQQLKRHGVMDKTNKDCKQQIF